VVALLTLAACTARAEGRRLPPTSTTAAPVTTTTAPPPVSPLTGLPATNPANLRRQALVVKIENHPASRPQSGLDAADLVYEEQVEGGLTRFVAVFQSRDAGVVGPVRSVRPSDGEIVWPLKPLFAYAGGTAHIVPMLHKAPVVDVGVDAAPDAYYRRAGRQMPHNLYSSTQALYRAAKTPGAAPVSVFTYSDPKLGSVPAGSAAVSHLTVAVGDQLTNYDWDAAAHTWKRSHEAAAHLTDSGAQIAPTNVIVQFVQYKASPGDTDAAKSQVFSIDAVGQGDAWVLSQGRMVKGRWSKPLPESVTAFTDAAGVPMSVAPGTTWVELVPVGGVATVK
jgi:hypothetical protein